MLSSDMKKIALIGLGGLGVPAFLRLISHPAPLTIIVYEADVVEITNLHRQIIFNDSHIGVGKLDSLLLILKEEKYSNQLLNKNIVLNKYYIDQENIHELLNVDVVIDCTDNPSFKFLLNDFCKLGNVPLVHGGAQGESGFLMPISVGTKCLRCLFGDPESEALDELCTSCRISGILSAYSGLTGTLQAELALEMIESNLPLDFAVKIDSNGSRRITTSTNNECVFCTNLKSLDLREIKCPETFVYTKLALQRRTDNSQKLLINFSNQDSLINVEKSILEEGYSVYRKFMNSELNCYRLIAG